MIRLLHRLDRDIRVGDAVDEERHHIPADLFEDTARPFEQGLSFYAVHHNDRFLQNRLKTNPHAATAILFSWRCRSRSLIR